MISQKVHAFFDYIGGFLMIHIPWILGFEGLGGKVYTLIVVGIFLIVIALFARNKMGASRRIKPGLHLTLDVVAGLILAASPWLFNFHREVFLPHLIIGGLVVLVSVFTRRETVSRPNPLKEASEP